MNMLHLKTMRNRNGLLASKQERKTVSIRRIFMVLLCGFVLLSLVLSADVKGADFTGMVPAVSATRLSMNDQTYPVATDAIVIMALTPGVDGYQTTLYDLGLLGFIQNARVTIENGIVTKIVILEVHQ
jgi:hypothetical protein